MIPPTPSTAWIAFGAAQLLFVLGLATRSRILRLAVFFPICSCILLHVAFIGSFSQSTPKHRIQLNCASLNTLMRVFELFLCSHDVQVEYVRVTGEPTDMPISKESFWRRLVWGVRLLFSQRGGGWNWRVRGTPADVPYASKWDFAAACLARGAAAHFVVELLVYVIERQGPALTVQRLFGLLHGMMICASLVLTYETMCLMWVVACKGSVDECPPLNGSLWHARSLKGFWGIFWHQCFRRSFSVLSNRLLALFGFGADRTGIAVFILSGIYHALHMYAGTQGKRWLGTFVFFTIQPVGFIIEKHVLHIQARPNWMGFVWVFTWFIVTAKFYTDDWVYGGLFDDVPVAVQIPLFGPLITKVLS